MSGRPFSYQIFVRSGVLCSGMSFDFLALIVGARESKARFVKELPQSTVRVRLFYPNGERVSREDIRAALRALSDRKVSEAVSARILSAKAAFPAPARSEARTEAGKAAFVAVFLVVLASLFFQAGVVAPPEGSTGETCCSNSLFVLVG